MIPKLEDNSLTSKKTSNRFFRTNSNLNEMFIARMTIAYHFRSNSLDYNVEPLQNYDQNE